MIGDLSNLECQWIRMFGNTHMDSSRARMINRFGNRFPAQGQFWV